MLQSHCLGLRSCNDNSITVFEMNYRVLVCDRDLANGLIPTPEDLRVDNFNEYYDRQVGGRNQ